MLWHFHASDGRLLPPIILDRFIVQHTAAAIPLPFRQVPVLCSALCVCLCACSYFNYFVNCFYFLFLMPAPTETLVWVGLKRSLATFRKIFELRWCGDAHVSLQKVCYQFCNCIHHSLGDYDEFPGGNSWIRLNFTDSLCVEFTSTLTSC